MSRSLSQLQSLHTWKGLVTNNAYVKYESYNNCSSLVIGKVIFLHADLHTDADAGITTIDLQTFVTAKQKYWFIRFKNGGHILCQSHVVIMSHFAQFSSILMVMLHWIAYNDIDITYLAVLLRNHTGSQYYWNLVSYTAVMNNNTATF